MHLLCNISFSSLKEPHDFPALLSHTPCVVCYSYLVFKLGSRSCQKCLLDRTTQTQSLIFLNWHKIHYSTLWISGCSLENNFFFQLMLGSSLTLMIFICLFVDFVDDHPSKLPAQCFPPSQRVSWSGTEWAMAGQFSVRTFIILLWL